MAVKKLLYFAVITSLGLTAILAPSCFADASGTVNVSRANGTFWFNINSLLGDPVQESKNQAFSNQVFPFFLLSHTQDQWKSLIRLRASVSPSISGDFASYSFTISDYIYTSNTSFDANAVFNNLVGLPHTLTFNYTDGTSNTFDCTRYGDLVPFKDNNNRPSLRAVCAVKVTKKPSNWVHQIGFDTVVYNAYQQPFVNDYIVYNGSSARNFGIYYGSSSYSYEYKTSDSSGGDTPSGQDPTADALNEIHEDEKNTINENGQAAQDSADGLNIGFSVGNPFLNWFALFRDDTCVSIPSIKSWLGIEESQVCSPWNGTPVRGVATPIFSILGGMILFGFIVRWLKGSDFDGSIQLDG